LRYRKEVAEKPFGLFLLVSFLWHMLWMFGVIVVVAPVDFQLPGIPRLTFVGGIFEDFKYNGEFLGRTGEGRDLNAVSTGKSPVPPGMDVRLPQLITPREEVYAPAYAGSGAISEVLWSGYRNEKISESGAYYGEKVVPRPEKVTPLADEKKVDVQIEGPVKDRKIFYMPPMPRYPRWAEEAGLDFDVELKFSVDVDGSVGFVEPFVSSGDSEIDILSIRYMRSWRFEPLSAQNNHKPQWGIIRLNFRLR
jgi:TonB family protein